MSSLAPEHSRHSQRVLILGDGNFSFSAAFCRWLAEEEQVADSAGRYAITTSSFDDETSLVEKYPEMVHGIDATRDLRKQLLSDKTFDHIIFNFPHIGIEDEKVHCQLLGHILFRCQEAISDGGNMYISLAEGQETRWRLFEMADRNATRLVSSHLLSQQALLGYQMRRHQTGRSFAGRIDCGHCYVFRKKSNPGSCLVDLVGLVLSRCFVARDVRALEDSTEEITPEPNPADKAVGRNKRPRESAGLSGSGSDSAGEKLNTKLDRPNSIGKGRGKMLVAESGYIKVEDPMSNMEFPIFTYECKHCKKHFKSEQGARTHVYMVHVLNDVCASTSHELTGLSDPIKKKEAVAPDGLFCEHCGALDGTSRRQFPNAEALLQHVRSKHASGDDDTPKKLSIGGAQTGETDTSKPHPESTDGEGSLAFECPACGVSFTSVDAVTSHLENGISPPAVSKIHCSLCARSFQSERALFQHKLSCESKKERQSGFEIELA